MSVSEHHEIVFEGKLQPGVPPEQARQCLAALFRRDVDAIAHLFSTTGATCSRKAWMRRQLANMWMYWNELVFGAPVYAYLLRRNRSNQTAIAPNPGLI